jgi:ArsR family transcriptional regulator
MPVDVESDVGAVLKLLGEPLRGEIVQRLAVEDLCTCHLAADLDASQPLVSHHLRALRQAGIVRAEPLGAFTYYVLDRAMLARLADVVGRVAAAGRSSPRRQPCA